MSKIYNNETLALIQSLISCPVFPVWDANSRYICPTNSLVEIGGSHPPERPIFFNLDF